MLFKPTEPPLFFVGQAIRNAILRTVDPNFESFFELFPAYLDIYKLHLDKGFVYPVNAIFDILTVILTTFLVMRFFRSRNLIWASRFILIDFVLCALLFYLCLFLIVSHNAITAPQGGILKFHQHIGQHLGEPAMFAHWLSSGMAYSATVFYPTLIYLLIFIGLILAAAFIRLLRCIGLFYAESAVDNQKSVFFVTGTFMGIIAAFTKAAVQFLT